MSIDSNDNERTTSSPEGQPFAPPSRPTPPAEAQRETAAIPQPDTATFAPPGSPSAPDITSTTNTPAATEHSPITLPPPIEVGVGIGIGLAPIQAVPSPTLGSPVPLAPTSASAPPTSSPTSSSSPKNAIEDLLDADGSVVVVMTVGGAVRSANTAALALLGVENLSELRPNSTGSGLLRSFLDHVPQPLLNDANGGTWRGDFDHTNTVGDPIILRATVVVRHDAVAGGPGVIAFIAHDVTESRLENARLRHRASHDPLTGLANRRQVLTILRDLIKEQRGKPGHVAAIFIDVDHLKYVNDALGHEVGDRLLVSAASRLAEAVRPDDYVARIGGDEFLVVCQDMPDAVMVLDLSERIRRALSGRLRVKQLDLEFSVSIGIALSDAELLSRADADAASILISHADTAMYEAKKAGRSRCALFTARMSSEARERTGLAATLLQAINENQLTLEYQPVFSAVSQSAVGAEALVRWQHPTRGPMDAATFISIAEESGSINRLGEFVLRQAVTDLRLWIDQQLIADDFSLHANVSELQLASSSFVHNVLELLREYKIQPQQLVLEARETALTTSNIDVQRTVRALRRVGIRVAVDNFGTGANALSVLTDVGADILKLDGSLALPTGSTEADTRLVRALVLLAHALDMHVVAERVGDTAQLQRLRAAGCDFLQGNLLAPPTPSEHFTPNTSF